MSFGLKGIVIVLVIVGVSSWFYTNDYHHEAIKVNTAINTLKMPLISEENSKINVNPVLLNVANYISKNSRPDIDDWIKQQKPELQPWLTKTADSMQRTLLITTHEQAEAAMPEIAHLVQCGYQLMPSTDPVDKADETRQWLVELENRVANTPERLIAYTQAKALFNGVVSSSDPAESPNNCS